MWTARRNRAKVGHIWQRWPRDGGRAMSDWQHDDYWMHDGAPLPVAYAGQAAEAIREATYRMQRMQLARQAPQRLDVHSLTAMGAALEDITRGLAQFAGQVAAAL